MEQNEALEEQLGQTLDRVSGHFPFFFSLFRDFLLFFSLFFSIYGGDKRINRNTSFRSDWWSQTTEVCFNISLLIIVQSLFAVQELKKKITYCNW